MFVKPPHTLPYFLLKNGTTNSRTPITLSIIIIYLKAPSNWVWPIRNLKSNPLQGFLVTLVEVLLHLERYTMLMFVKPTSHPPISSGWRMGPPIAELPSLFPSWCPPPSWKPYVYCKWSKLLKSTNHCLVLGALAFQLYNCQDSPVHRCDSFVNGCHREIFQHLFAPVGKLSECFFLNVKLLGI